MLIDHESELPDVLDRWSDRDPSDPDPLLVLDSLRAFLAREGFDADTLEPSRLGDGHSNVTYLLRLNDRELVLRRPPRGPLAPSTHDVEREALILLALRGHARVPHVHVVCDDPGVIGAPFFVMELVQGDVLTSELPRRFDPRFAPANIGSEIVETLVEMHAVDWRAAGLEGFGRPTGYLERQTRRFRGLWEQHRTRAVPAVDQVADWLEAHRPSSGGASIVHGDYRLGNIILARSTQPRVIAVLDWEMSTIGDPLADVGYLSALWGAPPSHFDLEPVTREPGFASAAEIVARYETRSGRAVRSIAWYQALALWKLAVLMEGNYRRARDGLSEDRFAAGFAAGVVELAERAAATAGIRTLPRGVSARA